MGMTTYDQEPAVPPLAVVADRQRTMQATLTNLGSRLRKRENDAIADRKDIDGLEEGLQRLTKAVERGNRILVSLLISAVLGSTSVTIAILLSTAKGKFHIIP
jgi:hypothetical protein